MAGLTSNTPLLPAFLAVEVGDAVLVEPFEGDWWVGQVIHREGGARCNGNSFFQIADVDTGRVETVNPNLVTGIIRKGYLEEDLAVLPHRPRKASPRVSKPSDQSFRSLELGVVGRAL